MSKAVKVIGIGCGSIVALVGIVVVTFIVIASLGPETSVYPGHQVPGRYMETLRSLHLLEESEQIRFFYSDAFYDIKSGLYFVTDKHLVLYSDTWSEPETIIPFDRIASLDVHYNDSFWEDSYVFITTDDGMEVSFPVSSEMGLDRKFVEAIQEHMNMDQDPPEDKE